LSNTFEGKMQGHWVRAELCAIYKTPQGTGP